MTIALRRSTLILVVGLWLYGCTSSSPVVPSPNASVLTVEGAGPARLGMSLEEFGVECVISGTPIVCENIFEHEGTKGHEVIFAFPITFADAAIYSNRRFVYSESDGTEHYAEWVSFDRFRSGADNLFPSVIAASIVGM